jgi:exopolyphosphatase/guanosine-5'-triphosphate,3'-diphosphate pyrophosphatase
MSRVAAVDLGTNSTRLLVADVESGALAEVSRRLTITRLGEGVDQRRRLLPVPIARVRNCLVEYRRELESLGAVRTLCIATSSVRDAENGEAFLGEVEWSYGFTTRLLSGEEEAAMMIRGVTTGRPALDGVLVVDIGGGSTELVLAENGEVSFSKR